MINQITAKNGKLVNKEGKVIFSDNQAWFKSVATDGIISIAVGYSSNREAVVYYSIDDVVWQPTVGPYRLICKELILVRYRDGQFHATGLGKHADNHLYFSSDDGIHWSRNINSFFRGYQQTEYSHMTGQTTQAFI